MDGGWERGYGMPNLIYHRLRESWNHQRGSRGVDGCLSQLVLLVADKKHHLRLLVNERLVTVYLDDELMINYYLDGLQPGEFALTAQGKAVFTHVDFRPGAVESLDRRKCL